MKTNLSSILLFLLLSIPALSLSQIIDFRKDQHTVDGAPGSGDKTEEQFEWLNSGRFGFNGDLSVQATAQILRYRIGEKDGFNIPLYFLSTASGEGLDETSAEQLTLNKILNPTAGIFNALITDSYPIIAETGKSSSFSFIFGSGYKMINGKSEKLDTTINISTFYGDVGFRFVTGAWVDGAEEKKGTFGIQIKGFATTPLSDKDQIKEIFGPDTEPWFVGISADIVLYISSEIDLRFNISRSLSQEKITSSDLNRTVVNFSVNYAL